MLTRRAGPRCPSPTTLWTTARPSKTADLSPLPPSVSCLHPSLDPHTNPRIQPASHSVTPQLNHGCQSLYLPSESEICAHQGEKRLPPPLVALGGIKPTSAETSPQEINGTRWKSMAAFAALLDSLFLISLLLVPAGFDLRL